MSNNVNWFGDEVYKEVIAKVENKLTAFADSISYDIKQDMMGSKSGINYSPGSGDERAEWMPEEWRKNFRTTSSAPGESPAAQQSTLQNSIQIEELGHLSRRVGTNLEYALWLETGTRKIKPRPFLRPAFLRALSRAKSIF